MGTKRANLWAILAITLDFLKRAKKEPPKKSRGRAKRGQNGPYLGAREAIMMDPCALAILLDLTGAKSGRRDFALLIHTKLG